MSAIKDLVLDIETLLDQGHQPKEVAVMLDVPVEFVYEVEDGDYRNTTEVVQNFG